MTSKTPRLTTCHRHPSQPLTGFCASCLRERLAGIESTSSASSPKLRRTKSCSGSGPDPHSSSTAVLEPRRKSCAAAVPPRNTLWDLFSRDDKPPRNVDLGNSGQEIRDCDGVGEGIRVCVEDDEETKTMKEFIDLELKSKKSSGRDFREIAGSFWDAASVFSKRLMKRRRKQSLKRNLAGGGRGGVGLTSVEVANQGGRNLRETQSEVGEYGFSLGRRSCDTDPRLSVDDPRFSFEAPRASWDGYLIGKTYPRLSPMVPFNGVVDGMVLVEEEEEEEEEEVNLENGEGHCPGGSAETMHYYSDRRRRSFDTSNSRRKMVTGDNVDDLRVVSNAKVSPATTELFYGAKVLITENDLRDANLKSRNSVQSDCVIASASKDACDVGIGVGQKGLKKFQKWGRLWTKLGLVHRRKEGKLGKEECGTGDIDNKPIAEPWQKLRRAVNGQASESVSEKLIRSYSVSCRNQCSSGGLVNGLGVPETKGNVLNGRQELMLPKNRSVRHSSNNVDAGLLRFYLTPLKSYRRSRSGMSSLKDSFSTARSSCDL
ncbi:protein OCTOPUS-like [Lotus japonicus]|uniref:protein OCTOPUS-like n=1 Tax=Lotus japonicus TaxID=34305 RepID=UPI002589B946|nr:protein OCTOPUS-like [Lotus japonicus]